MAQADCVSNAVSTSITGASLILSNGSMPATLKDLARFREGFRRLAILLAADAPPRGRSA